MPFGVFERYGIDRVSWATPVRAPSSNWMPAELPVP